MYPSFGGESKAAIPAKGKKSSKRKSNRLVSPSSPTWPVDEDEDTAGHDASDITHATPEIVELPTAGYTFQQPQIPTIPQAHDSRHAPEREPIWDSSEPAQMPYMKDYGSYSPKPSTSQVSRRPSTGQSPVASPLNRFPGLQSPVPSSPRLQYEYRSPQNQFPHHPPPNPNLPQASYDRNAVLQEDRLHFRSFDTLQASGDSESLSVENIVLSGYDNWLEVSVVDRENPKLIARLDVGRDIVLGAKIIPCTSRQDHFREFRPLVVLIVHGSVWVSDSGEQVSPQGEFNQSGVELYQTRVEVRSLRTGEHVTTLYASPPSTPPRAAHGHADAQLSIDAEGIAIVVASGVSGEIFVFAPSDSLGDPSEEKFRCIAKFWTCTRRCFQPSDPQQAVVEEDVNSNRQVPIFALSQRWLAIAPPQSPSRHSVQGTVPISRSRGKPPGVESVTAPAPPSSSCSLDIPDPETFTNKVAKGVAKEVVRGAQWVGAQGWQAWQSYWNKSPQHLRTDSGIKGENSGASPQFPPTHAEHQRTNSEELSSCPQVAIFDLQLLLQVRSSRNHNRNEPIAAFTAPSGCSFLSFSPCGLFLLTVNQTGDTQHVWDLLGLYPRKTLQKSGSSVRQVARFSRFTNASVVDVAWSVPKSDKFAMVTERGTIHILKLPISAFAWPPPVLPRSPEVLEESSNAPSTSLSTQEDTRLPLGQPSRLSSAASKVSGTARPIVETVRRGSNSGVSMLASNLGDFHFSTAAGLQKGKALAAGVSKSLGAAAGQINQIRRGSESRFHFKRGGARRLQPRCVRLMTGQELRGFVGALSNDTLALHWFESGQHPQGISDTVTGSSSQRHKDVEIALPLPEGLGGLAGAPSRSFFRPNRPGPEDSPSASRSSVSLSREHHHHQHHPLSYAELETSAPFRPIYTDRRVVLSTYTAPEPWDIDSGGAHKRNSDSPWAFGTYIASETANVAHGHGPDPLESKGKETLEDELNSAREIHSLQDFQEPAHGQQLDYEQAQEGSDNALLIRDADEDVDLDLGSQVLDDSTLMEHAAR